MSMDKEVQKRYVTQIDNKWAFMGLYIKDIYYCNKLAYLKLKNIYVFVKFVYK